MKYIIKIERFGPKLYKSGDYVLVSSIYWGLNHEPMIIDKEVEDDVFACSFAHGYPQSVGFNKRIGSGAEFDRDEIIRKMEPHEISAIKYNL